MQVFLPRSFLVVVGIPLWSHQLISWYFPVPVSLSQPFVIPFDLYSHVCSFLSQYPYKSPLTPLQSFPILITISETHINLKWSLTNLINCPTHLLHLHELISKATLLPSISLHHCIESDTSLSSQSSIILGWEFQFLVSISGTLIEGVFPILFTIPKILVGFFFWNSDFWRVRKLEFRFAFFGITAISCTGTQYILLMLICIDSKACTMI